MTLTMAYLGLGSNLGDRESNLCIAIDSLQEFATRVKVSSFHETTPQGFRDQPVFLNAACLLVTRLDPFGLLHELKRIEGALGRGRSFINAPRTLDLDILLYGGLVLKSPGLVIPHPRMAERAFVLAPLAEIAPDAYHPALKADAHTLLRMLRSREGEA